jgi:excisionase family DNA binding protein
MTNAQILTIQEAAAYLRITPEILQQELEARRIIGAKIGEEWRIDRRVLEAYLRGQQLVASEIVEGEIRHYRKGSQTGHVAVHIGRIREPYVLVFQKNQLSAGHIPLQAEIVDVEIRTSGLGVSPEVVSIRRRIQSDPTPVTPLTPDPEQAQHFYAQAVKARDAKNYEQARGWFTQAVALGAIATCYLAFSKMEFNYGSQTLAENIAAEGVKRHPNHADLRSWQASMHRQLGRYEQARKQLDALLAQNPNNPMAQRELILTLIEIASEQTLSLAGSIIDGLVAQGKLRPDDKLVQSYQQKKPIPRGTSPESSKQKSAAKSANQGSLQARAHYEKAKEHSAQGDLFRAEQEYRKAIEVGASVDIYTAYFTHERRRGHAREARRIIEKAKEDFPGHAQLYVLHGQLERRAEDYENAVRIFDAGLAKNPKHHNLQISLLQSLFEHGTEQSLQRCEQIYQQLKDAGRLTSELQKQLYPFVLLQQSPRAMMVYTFFRAIGVQTGVDINSERSDRFIDMIVTLNGGRYGDLWSSFGLSGGVLVRCYETTVTDSDVLEVELRLQRVKEDRWLNKYRMNPKFAFIAAPSVEPHALQEQFRLLADSVRAIIPLNDNAFRHIDETQYQFQNQLGAFLGRQELYSLSVPVFGRPFFGRELVIKQVADEVGRGQFLGVYGLRKMGKTSLLRHLEEGRFREELVAFVDLEDLVDTTCAALYYQIEGTLRDNFVQRGIEADSFLRLTEYEKYTDLIAVYDRQRIRTVFREDIQHILRMLINGEIEGASQLIIMLDELEIMLPLNGQPGFEGQSEFFTMLRGLAQNNQYFGKICNVVISANPSLSESPYWGAQENKVFKWYKPFYLPPFTNEEMDVMVRTLGRQMGVTWDDQAIELLYDETSGHPFLTRAFCAALVTKFEQRPLQVDAPMVQQCLQDFSDTEGSDILNEIMLTINRHYPEERDLLINIAHGKTTDRIDPQAIRHLRETHLVKFDESQQQYRITIHLLHRWLNLNKVQTHA